MFRIRINYNARIRIWIHLFTSLWIADPDSGFDHLTKIFSNIRDTEFRPGSRIAKSLRILEDSNRIIGHWRKMIKRFDFHNAEPVGKDAFTENMGFKSCCCWAAFNSACCFCPRFGHFPPAPCFVRWVDAKAPVFRELTPILSFVCTLILYSTFSAEQGLSKLIDIVGADSFNCQYRSRIHERTIFWGF